MLRILAPAPALTPAFATGPEAGADRSFAGLRTALGSLLAAEGETMTWTWNGIPLRVGYRAPFSDAYHDVLGCVEALLQSPASGKTICRFTEYALMADWTLAWNDHHLTVDALWHQVHGADLDLLRRHPRLEMPVPAFLAEWKMPLRRLVETLDRTGATCPSDPGSIDRLRRLEAALPAFGRAYASDGMPLTDSRAA